MNKINTTKVYVQKSTIAKGYGVFAAHSLKKDELIEVCPAIMLPMKDFETIKTTKLYYYYFEYTNKEVAIFLGYGSLYNHSYTPNARYLFDFKNKYLRIYALAPIAAHEEIMLNYNYYPSDKTPLEDWYRVGVDV